MGMGDSSFHLFVGECQQYSNHDFKFLSILLTKICMNPSVAEAVEGLSISHSCFAILIHVAHLAHLPTASINISVPEVFLWLVGACWQAGNDVELMIPGVAPSQRPERVKCVSTLAPLSMDYL